MYTADAERFDLIHMADVIEHLRDPRKALRHLQPLLKVNGVLVLTTCDVGSLSARLLGRSWPNFKREHLFYPDRHTIGRLLESEGFRVCSVEPAVKALSFSFARDYFRVYGPRAASKLAELSAPLIPERLARRDWYVSAGDMLVLAERA
jgi:SAM-dependent methyltransferase